MSLAEQIEAVAETAQDDESRGFQRLAETTRLPLLLEAGWRCRVHGSDGLGIFDRRRRGVSLRFIHSIARELDSQVWAHLSLSQSSGQMPDWVTVRDVFREVCGPDAIGIVVIPPVDRHVNLGEVAHVWQCLTAAPVPDFTHGLGTI